MEDIVFKPIGYVKSPHINAKGSPIQSSVAKGHKGTVVVYEEYKDGLKDLEGFSHIILLYHFHLIKDVKLFAIPFMDNVARGIFAIRSPARPNPIGLSVLEIESIEGNLINVKNIDVLNNTPVIDIKPYVPQFDSVFDAKIGWMESKISSAKDKRDDGRFLK
jgi:tRNA-Thr(GGU) m(6)t(6)A37 methyltransferase TsaA